jgi:putative ATPase
MDLFDSAEKEEHSTQGPLAARMRPRNLDEYIGQDHIVGKGRLLRRAIAADQLTSVIFYGPPGTGKTTLARVIANYTKSNFITLNAVLTGVQNIRDAIKMADEQKKLYNKRTILFVDEVHRWNKSQQDALLPWVENGTLILVGATTENPFFEVNKALVSRSRVFQLKPLEAEDLAKAAKYALTDKERGYGRWNVQFEEGALEHLIDTANGDARSLLNALELAVETTPQRWAPNENPCEPPEGSTIFISKETAEESIQKKVVLYDRDGDYHYDIISAFIKSLRGRDPDAAMYWMARMIAAGEDPHFIFRRMIISACEDTGLADPHALGVVESCAAAFDRIGLPEGRYMLAHAALYLATAPKSNSSMCFFDALSAVAQEDAEVPNHLRDNSRDAEGFGHGAGYLYPHAYKDHWVAQQYLPDSINGRVFYNPTDQGYEKTIKEEVLSRRELQIASLLEEENNPLPLDTEGNPIGQWWEAEKHKNGVIKKEEQLTFSPDNKMRSRMEATWQRRTESKRTEALLALRNEMIDKASLNRHHRSLIMGADDGLLLWEVWRKCPEGITVGLCNSTKGKEILDQYAKTLGELDRPLIITQDQISTLSDVLFDRVFFRNPVINFQSISILITQLEKLKPYMAKNSVFIIAQQIPSKAQRIAAVLQPLYPQKASFLSKVLEVENEFFTNNENPLFSWTEKDIVTAVIDSGLFVSEGIQLQNQIIQEERIISERDMYNWFDNPNSAYGTFLEEKVGTEQKEEFKTILQETINKTSLLWKTYTAYITLPFMD